MPRRHRGHRIPLTVRFPFDSYREVAIRAKARNWSISDYVAWCVAKELSGNYVSKSHMSGPRSEETMAMSTEWIEELEHG